MKIIQVFLRIMLIAIALISSCSVNAQDSMLINKYEQSLIKKNIDKIKIACIQDSNRNEILFFNVDYVVENAYGCVVFKDVDSLYISKLFLKSGKNINTVKQKSTVLEKNFFDKLFKDPKKYVDYSFLINYRGISHNNIMYLFIKINGAIFFDKYFLRSNFIASPNTNSIKFIFKLQELSG